MEHVLVPVPEELADDVRLYVQRTMLLSTNRDTNPAAVREVVEACSGTMRLVVHRIAEEAVHDRAISLADLAEELGTSTHEVLGLCHDLNSRIAAAGGPPALVLPQPDPSERPAGRSDFDHRLLVMARKQASVITKL